MINPIYKIYIHRPTTNLLDPGLVMRGYSLSASTGEVAASATMQVSDYMPVTPEVEYALRNTESIAMAFIAIAFYDAGKTFISGSSENLVEEAPEGAAYTRISLPLSFNAADWQFAEARLNYSEHISSLTHAVYGDDISINFEKESGQEFFRRKFSGDLIFEKNDYDFIVAQDFDHEFKVEIYISYDRGLSWASYWKGKFWKTDCDFDDDDKKVVVTPNVDDDYEAVLAGMEKEFDLIPLTPEIAIVKGDKRPAMQFYLAYNEPTTSVGCYLSGMWWEQECGEPESPQAMLDMGFGVVSDKLVIEITQTMGGPTLPPALFGDDPQPVWSNGWECSAGGYKLICEPLGAGVYGYRIVEEATGTTLWITTYGSPSPLFETLHLIPYSGGGATGEIDIFINDLQIRGRLITDKYVEGAVELGPDDIVMDKRNYRYAVPINYQYDPAVVLTSRFSSDPTEWGIRQPGQYYEKPETDHPSLLFPISRSLWGPVSVWFDSSQVPDSVDADNRAPFTLKDAYPLPSVISVLLGQIAPDITHEGTTDYSRFLYSAADPLTAASHTLFLAPKSNVVTSGYDQPAQKALVRFSDITEMLRDCYRCYWFIDENKRFRIEHIEFFRRGGTYDAQPAPDIDLTASRVPTSGKPLAYATSEYKFGKPEMAAWYQFGWMDDVRKEFIGESIKILSRYVNPENVQEVSVKSMTSDVDYILINPSAVSRDGFALLNGVYDEGRTIEEYNLSSYETINRQLGTDGKWMTNSNKHILIPVTAGQRLKITGGPNYSAQLAWFTSDATPVAGEDAPLVGGTSRFTRAKNTTAYYIVPPGANFLYVFWGQTSDPAAYMPSSVVLVEPAAYFLPYVRIGDALLQNGTLSFQYLQIYYDWDMPAKRYEIGSTAHTAVGVKKLKEQNLTFPCYRDPDVQKLVKTFLGNGKIGKLSINLSSRSAKATLMYDTE